MALFDDIALQMRDSITSETAQMPTPFSHPALTFGSRTLSGSIAVLDALAQRIGGLPDVANSPIPGVSQHVANAKALANSWLVDCRNHVVGALQGLADFGNGFISSSAPLLRQDFLTAATDPSAMAMARVRLASLVSDLAQRSGIWAGAVASVEAYLSQMTASVSQLQTDASLAAQRLGADTVHAVLLQQQANDLQSQLDDARSRQRYYWLLGPLGYLIASEIDSLASNLSGVQSQLDSVQADLAQTSAEGTVLQSLVPAMTSYVAAVSAMAASVNGLTAATQALQSQLAQVSTALETSPNIAVFANAQLDASIQDWQIVGQSIGDLPQTAFG
ncbi:MAG TPA: hypothetical protein VD887_10030 [Allosphingosinicella sp.]|nr:hypothetical protein [Allosphingosinicella sp.]